MSSANYSFSNTSNRYDFQQRAADDSLAAAMKSGKAICAIACGGGKTTVSQLIISKYIAANGSKSRILVITENNNALKNQFLDELNHAHVAIDFSFGEITTSQNVQVRVGIAASLHKLQWDKIDLVICDEAHRHFRKKRIQQFLKSIPVRHQILFTGTPALFIKDNESTLNKAKIILVSGAELHKRGLYAGVDLDVIRAINKNDSIQTIKEFISHACRVKADLTKTLLVCPTIIYAESVSKYLASIGKKVFLSTSKNDSDNRVLIESKNWIKSIAAPNCFIVTVGKCNLGYNDPAVTTLADLRSSLGSLSSNQQIFARILRDSPQSSRKFYFRFSQSNHPNSYNDQVLMLVKLKAFMREEVFSGFTGANLKIETCHD